MRFSLEREALILVNWLVLPNRVVDSANLNIQNA